MLGSTNGTLILIYMQLQISVIKKRICLVPLSTLKKFSFSCFMASQLFERFDLPVDTARNNFLTHKLHGAFLQTRFAMNFNNFINIHLEYQLRDRFKPFHFLPKTLNQTKRKFSDKISSSIFKAFSDNLDSVFCEPGN